jgi:hypothetical protein
MSLRIKLANWSKYFLVEKKLMSLIIDPTFNKYNFIFLKNPLR